MAVILSLKLTVFKVLMADRRQCAILHKVNLSVRSIIGRNVDGTVNMSIIIIKQALYVVILPASLISVFLFYLYKQKSIFYSMEM